MQVGTCITEDYLSRARPFLESLGRVNAQRFCICLGFVPTERVPGTDYRTIPRHPSESHGMLQHGRWLPDDAPDDVYLLSDGGDVTIHRDFGQDELERFAGYDDQTFGIGPNYGPADTLLDEAARIDLRDLAPYGELLDVPVGNCGVMIARAAAWRRLRDRYEQHCEAFYARTDHRSRCQWLICWCLHPLGMRLDWLGPELHSHGHFGRPPRASFRGKALYTNGRPVMFRHALEGP